MLITLPYDRERAVRYARRWAMSRNPLFANFTGLGGDCTNFVSQAVYAGSCIMNLTPTFGWYYISPEDRAPAWTGVEFFYNFMTGNDGIGPYATETGAGGLDLGDVIQLGNGDGDWFHTLVVTGFQGNEYLVCAHSADSLDRPLSSYRYDTLRFLHMEGVRGDVNGEEADVWFHRPQCFAYVFSGGGEYPKEDGMTDTREKI